MGGFFIIIVTNIYSTFCSLDCILPDTKFQFGRTMKLNENGDIQNCPWVVKEKLEKHYKGGNICHIALIT